jgi:uncharacterized protein YjbI with pentapeptide repeats
MTRKNREHFERALRTGPRWLAQHPQWGVLIVVLLVLVLLAFCIVYLPGPIAAHDLGDSAQSLPPENLLKAKNDIRTALLQGLGGLFFVTTAFFTWRQVRLKSDEQITDRFNAAIDHIGDDTKMDVRLGGIHALDRIARDSERDREAIIDILVTYIQRRSPRKRSEPEDSPDHDDKATADRGQSALASSFLSLRARAPDVQAALNALRRDFLDTKRIRGIELPNIDYRFAVLAGADFLSGVDLSGAFLSGADLTGADLSFAKLSGSDLSGSDLSGAFLSGTGLTGADLSFAKLSGADLSDVGLTGANLTGAKLSGANLMGAFLTGADLSFAKLSGSDLSFADLSRANITDADLSGAKAVAKGEDATTWPAGFTHEEARARGVIFVDEPETERPATDDSQPAQPH